MTAVTTARPFRWDAALDELRYDILESGLDLPCFHATNDRQWVRDRVFATLSPLLPAARVDCVYVEKARMPRRFCDAVPLYSFVLGRLMRRVVGEAPWPASSEAIVIADAIPVQRKQDAMTKAIKQSLSAELPESVRYRLLHHTSASCRGLQVADYLSWVIFRARERGDARSLDLVRASITSDEDATSEVENRG